jgi:Skp family chaperone for outer membrane proteins
MKHRQVRSLLIAATIAVQALWVADSTPASAQQQVPVVVGVVDAEGLLQDSKAGQSLKAQAEKTQKSIKSDFDKQQKQFDDDARKLVQQKDTLSAEDLQKKKEELRQRGDQQTKALNERQRLLDVNINKGRDQIVRAMVDAVKDVAKAHGLTLVVSRSGTPYFDSSYDVTPEVKQKLDAKLPSLKLQQSSDAQ